ncbi:MAG: alpha/beta hydrolase [Clostridia bacterium]|nr:alpha/beta hydrolase [Clostridia bacterium]
MAIEKRQGFFTSDNRRDKIRTLIWADDKVNPVGVVQIVPSFGDHIGRYDAFARFLAGEGFVVCGNDHLGTGLSVPDDAARGAMLPGEHLSVLRDMNTLHRLMLDRYPGLPVIMAGFGVGSFLARIYCRSFAKLLAGALFVGTSQLPDWVCVFEDGARRLLEALPPSVSASAALPAIFGKLTKKLYKDDHELAWLSSSENALVEYLRDPLLKYTQTVDMTAEELTILIKGSRPVNCVGLPEGFPVMFLSGGKDSVGLFGRGVINASDLYMAAGVTPEVVLYPVMRHEILHEDGKEKVFEDVLAFFRACV